MNQIENGRYAKLEAKLGSISEKNEKAEAGCEGAENGTVPVRSKLVSESEQRENVHHEMRCRIY
jgi:hypothetical protein